MKLNRNSLSFFKDGQLKKYYLIMRLTWLLILILTLPISASVWSQTMSVKLKNSTLQELFVQIEKSSNYRFFYNNDDVDVNQRISVDIEEKTIGTILNSALEGLPYSFKELESNLILIERKGDKPISNGTIIQKQNPISGKVTDSSGSALPGVSIVIKGTTTGTITDVNGNYFISIVPDNSILLFSFMGMKTQEITIAGKSTINVTLAEESFGIEEVVAIGYGTKKKIDVLGSVASVSSEDLVKTSSSSVLNALQGRASGIQISQQSGMAGSDYTVKIRGIHSINSGNDPLWIIDGMPGSANDLNPSDIQSVDVLKDASATAIYGSRGSNGVIIITTKMGKSDKGEISFNYKSGVSNVMKTPSDYGYANTTQWFSVIDEARKNSGINTPWEPMDILNINPDIVKPLSRQEAMNTNNNWFDQFTRQGTFQDMNLSSSRGTDKGSVFFSVNYYNQKSVIRHDDQRKISGRINADFKPVKILNLGARVNIINTTGNSGSYTKMYPWRPIYDANDLEGTGYWNVHSNQVAQIDSKYNLNSNETLRGIGGLYAELSIPFIQGLSLRTEGSFDYSIRNTSNWQSAKIRSLQSPNDGSAAGEGSKTYKSENYNLYSKYNRTFGNHDISATIGTESTRSNIYNRSMSAKYLLGSYQELGHDPGFLGSMEGRQIYEDYLRSYFGRADYKFKEKYLLGISIRRDGSSRFSPASRWGNFTAYSAGWIISEESFLKKIESIDLIKLRGSFGQTGNNQVAFNRSFSYYVNSFDYSYGSKTLLSAGTRLSVLGNPELTWETTTSYDLGIDYGLFKNRISGSVAWYLQDVNGLVLAQPLPQSAGLAGGNEIWANVGRIINKGFEFSVSSINFNNKNFKWTTDFNITTNGNKVKNLTNDLDSYHKGIWMNKWYTRTGGPVRAYALAEYAGVDPEKGVDLIWEIDKPLFDATGEIKRTGRKIPGTDDNVSNTFSDTKKTPIPTYFGGLNNTFTYKGFDLSIMLTYSGGNYIYDSEKQGISRAGYGEWPAINAEMVAESWKKPGDNAKYAQLRWQDNYEWGWDTNAPNLNSPTKIGDWTFTPGGGASYKSNQHSRYLYKGDYVRVKYIEFGYNLSQNLCKKISIKDLRIYVSGQNLFTFTKYPGWDPELGDSNWGNVGGEGYASGDYTMSRTFNLGASLKF